MTHISLSDRFVVQDCPAYCMVICNLGVIVIDSKDTLTFFSSRPDSTASVKLLRSQEPVPLESTTPMISPITDASTVTLKLLSSLPDR